MRINNNMMAINTHRQMLVSQTAGAKSMEKLSSGYRINRAGDDAAGLAISEKMRGQIRGLNQASRNSQDMISLIQVAEGALAESHNILQRMRELAVQAANDTNTDADRFELNAEVKNLKNELDRIGNSTEYNTRKLLEGSARGVADEVPGTVRMNNNSNIVIDTLKFDAMAASVNNDKTWAFDGAYMLLKTNQTTDGNNNNVYNANDYKLIGPDGKQYSFMELAPNTSLDPGYIEPGSIASAEGVSTTFVAGSLEEQQELAGSKVTKAGGLDENDVTKIGIGSVLADSSTITLDDTGSVHFKVDGKYDITITWDDTNDEYTVTGTIDGEPYDEVFTIDDDIDIGDGNLISLDVSNGTITITGEAVIGTALTPPLDVTAYTIAEDSILSLDSDITGLTEGTEYENHYTPLTSYAKGVILAEAVDETKVTSIGSGSILAVGSSITLDKDHGGVIKLAGYLGLDPAEIEYAKDASGKMAFSLKLNGEEISETGIRTITLNDGTALELDASTGTMTIKKGSVTLAEAFTAESETVVTPPATPEPINHSFKLAIGTALTAETVVAAVDINIEGNYVLMKGELGANVTVGNTIPLTEADAVYLKEGTVLAKGSEITVKSDTALKLNVAGTEIDVTWDDRTSSLKVNGQVVALHKTIILDDGTVLTNRGGGTIEVTTGRITLARDLNPNSGSDSHNIASYKIAKDSTLMAGTQVEEGMILGSGTVFSEAGSHPFAGSVTLGAGGKWIQFGSNPGNYLEARYHDTEVSEGITFIFARYEPASNSLRDSIMAQIGANSGQITFVSMGDMRARALGVADINIATNWGAATAIETVNNALQRVSHQRAILGGIQNRLEHTISNLDTTSENMQAAESRIRDVDMAREIMENTKQQILQQAAQAMLAQANQIPQNVLQLLRG